MATLAASAGDYEFTQAVYNAIESSVRYPWPPREDDVNSLPNFDHLEACMIANHINLSQSPTQLAVVLPNIVLNGVLFKSLSCITTRQRNCDIKVSHVNADGDKYWTYGTIQGIYLYFNLPSADEASLFNPDTLPHDIEKYVVIQAKW